MTEPATQNSALQDPVDPARLTAYLETLPELRAALPLRSIEQIGRGQSNLTFRIELAAGQPVSSYHTVILRRPPVGPLPPSAHDVLREYRVMRALAGSEVPVPTLIAACLDPAVLGAPFFLMEDLPADAIRQEMSPALEDPAGRRAIGEQLIDTLAALHATDPATVGLADLGKPTGYIARQLRRWRGQLDYARVRAVPDLDWVSDWLERAMPPDVERPSIVHGDYKLDNALFSRQPPPLLMAVVDWEMATLGDPLADLGWLLAFWYQDDTPPRSLAVLSRLTALPGFHRRAELAERYAERSGRALPDLRFYHVLALWKMAVLLEGHWARHVRGTAGSFDFTYLEGGGPALQAYVRQVATESEAVP